MKDFLPQPRSRVSFVTIPWNLKRRRETLETKVLGSGCPNENVTSKQNFGLTLQRLFRVGHIVHNGLRSALSPDWHEFCSYEEREWKIYPCGLALSSKTSNLRISSRFFADCVKEIYSNVCLTIILTKNISRAKILNWNAQWRCYQVVSQYSFPLVFLALLSETTSPRL